MATNITITKLGFVSPLIAPISVVFKYRKQGDSSWINLNGGLPVPVAVDNTLASPLVIPNLLYATTYEISSQADCSAAYIEPITTPELACPVITDIVMSTNSDPVA